MRPQVPLPLAEGVPHGFSVLRPDVRDAHENLGLGLRVEEASLRGSGELTFARIDEVEDEHLVPTVTEVLERGQRLFATDEQVRSLTQVLLLEKKKKKKKKL